MLNPVLSRIALAPLSYKRETEKHLLTLIIHACEFVGVLGEGISGKQKLEEKGSTTAKKEPMSHSTAQIAS